MAAGQSCRSCFRPEEEARSVLSWRGWVECTTTRPVPGVSSSARIDYCIANNYAIRCYVPSLALFWWAQCEGPLGPSLLACQNDDGVLVGGAKVARVFPARGERPTIHIPSMTHLPVMNRAGNGDERRKRADWTVRSSHAACKTPERPSCRCNPCRRFRPVLCSGRKVVYIKTQCQGE
jgi:hypothetical protein